MTLQLECRDQFGKGFCAGGSTLNAQPVTTLGTLPRGRSLHSLPHPAQLMPAFLGMPFPVLLDGAMPGAPGSRFSYL